MSNELTRRCHRIDARTREARALIDAAKTMPQFDGAAHIAEGVHASRNRVRLLATLHYVGTRDLVEVALIARATNLIARELA